MLHSVELFPGFPLINLIAAVLKPVLINPLRFLSSGNCQLLTVVSLAYKVWRPLVSLSSCLNPVLYFLSGGNRVRLFQELGHNKVGEHPAGAKGQRPGGGQVWVLPR